MRHRWLLALAVVLAGCSSGDDDPEPPSSTSTTAGAAALPQTCTHPRFTIRYPQGWHTATAPGEEPCRFFHPEPFEVPPDTEVLDRAVSLKLEAVPFTVMAAPGGATETELRRTESEFDGRRWLILETESTGEGLLDAGIRSYRYVTELGPNETIVLSTIDIDDLDYEGNKRALEQMAATLAVA